MNFPCPCIFTAADGCETVGRLYMENVAGWGWYNGCRETQKYHCHVEKKRVWAVDGVEHLRHHLVRPHLGTTLANHHHHHHRLTDRVKVLQPTQLQMCQIRGWHYSAKYWYLFQLLHPFNGLFSRATWVSWYSKGKTSLDYNEARDDGLWGCSGISWTICKQSAPRSRQITTPTPHHSIFTGQMLFLMPNQQCQSIEGQL